MILTILFSFQIYLSLSSHHSDVIWHHVSVTPPSHHSSWVSSCVKRNQNSIQLFQNVFFNSFWKFWITWKSISDATSWIHQIQKKWRQVRLKTWIFWKTFHFKPIFSWTKLTPIVIFEKASKYNLMLFSQSHTKAHIEYPLVPKGQT